MAAKKKTGKKKAAPKGKKKFGKSGKGIPSYTPEQVERFRDENKGKFQNALKSQWANNPEGAQQALLGRGLAPQTTLGGVPAEMDVAGGQQQDQQALDAMRQASEAELARRNLGMGLMTQLQDLQRDPYNVVNAMQAYGLGGGGTTGAASSLAATGGQGRPSPYGNALETLMQQLIGFSTGQGGSEGPSANPAAPADPNADMIAAIGNNPEALATLQKNMQDRAAGAAPKPKYTPEQMAAYAKANPGVIGGKMTPEQIAAFMPKDIGMSIGGGPHRPVLRPPSRNPKKRIGKFKDSLQTPFNPDHAYTTGDPYGLDDNPYSS
jgi:hypothetical protein